MQVEGYDRRKKRVWPGKSDVDPLVGVHYASLQVRLNARNFCHLKQDINGRNEATTSIQEGWE